MRSVIALSLLLWAGLAVAAPTFDASSASTALDDSSETIQHVLGSGSDRLAVCAATYEDQTGTLTAPTFNGVSMSLAGTVIELGSNFVGMYYMLESSLPAAGTYDVVAGTSGDTENNGGLGLSCVSASNARQAEPSVFAVTDTDVTLLSDTVTFANVGDILFKATSAGEQQRTATHGDGSWTEIMDLQPGGVQDTAASAAYFTVTDQGSQTVTTTLSINVNRGVQVVARIEEAYTSPDSGTTIAFRSCPSSGSFTPSSYRAAEVCGPGQNRGCCPPIITDTAVQPNLTDTEVDAFFDTTAAYGTGYACLTTSGTPKTCAEIQAGTGCADTGSATIDSALSRASFEGASALTGSANTQYYVQVCHPNGRPESMVSVIGPILTPDTGETGGGTSGDPVPAGSLYVRCGLATGNNDGSDHDNAFQSWSDAVSASKATGQDMVFFEGTTCSVGTTSLGAWDGTQSNPTIIGSYYIDGSTPTLGYSTSRPNLNGTFTNASCSTADACGTTYAGLIDIDNEVDVVVRDLYLSNWYGRGVDAEGNNQASGNSRIRVENVKLHHVAREGILFKNTLDYTVAYGNYLTNIAMCADYKYSACPVRPAALMAGFRQGGPDWPAVNVFEGNTVLSSHSEGIGCYLADNCIIRGNVVGATFSGAIYMDHAPNFVIENNIVMGDPNNQFSSSNRNPSGIAIGDEDFINQERTSYGVVRNNLIANVKGPCFSGNNETEGDVLPYVYFIGNTCAYPKQSYVDWRFWTDINTLVLKSNIFYGGESTGCTLPSGTVADYNVWDVTPGDGDCRGANDVYNADPDFASDANLDAAGPTGFDGTGGTILTDFTDAELQAGSPAIGAGDPSLEDSSSCAISAGSLGFTHIQDGSPVEANWENCLYYDGDNGARSATAPDAGVVEN